QFVNVRLKVNTLDKAIVVPTAAVQRGPAGTFVYVIGQDSAVAARPVTVTLQNETIAVIATGVTVEDQVVTTGFANLSEGAKVTISKDYQAPTPDLAPRKRQGGGEKGQGQKGERRGQKEQGAAPQGGQQQTGGGAKAPQ
ncbi:MAG: efflux RND transporter periplasmic adaptor subunit, partial [Afipia sp.]